MNKKSEWQEFIKIKPESRGQYIKVTNYPKSESGYLVKTTDSDFPTIHEFFKFWKEMD